MRGGRGGGGDKGDVERCYKKDEGGEGKDEGRSVINHTHLLFQSDDCSSVVPQYLVHSTGQGLQVQPTPYTDTWCQGSCTDVSGWLSKSNNSCIINLQIFTKTSPSPQP